MSCLRELSQIVLPARTYAAHSPHLRRNRQVLNPKATSTIVKPLTNRKKVCGFSQCVVAAPSQLSSDPLSVR